MSQERIYKVMFFNQGKTYELYAREIGQGGLYGFVQVEDLVFGERSAMVVDPAEEKLRDEFAGVKRIFIPMHAVIRIDEVEKAGTGKIKDGEGNVTPFPGAFYPPGGSGKKES
jgi:hypothetical protein